MEQTLKQLGELLLGAIPTGVLLLVLYGLYHVIVHKPLEAVLAERRKRTQGAVEQARADIAVAATSQSRPAPLPSPRLASAPSSRLRPPRPSSTRNPQPPVSPFMPIATALP